jgi:predicted AAA+ superfamily ATPase
MRDMNIYPRSMEKPFGASESAGKVRLLFGARQTGKSTLLRRLATPDTVVFNLQERRVRLELERNPASFTQTLEADRRKRLSVHVDEIQKVPALLDEVQYLYDRNPERYAFVLTGSSARKLKTASANLLPGRAHTFHLCPLILPERKAHPAARVFPLPDAGVLDAGCPAATLENMLTYGNLPGIAQEAVASRSRTLESYVELYLEEEIRREALVRNVGAFQQFLELAALESGCVVNLTNLSRESGVPVATLRTFYQVLEDTFVGYRIPVFGAAGRKRVLTTPRFLFFDNGVRNAAARLRLSADLLKTQTGLLLENWVGQELMHRCLYAGRAYRLSFWRTAHGAEVDYVLETPGEVIPIEVKATESPRESDARHLKLFLETYPERAHRGFIVCRCRAPRRLTDRIEAVPWTML